MLFLPNTPFCFSLIGAYNLLAIKDVQVQLSNYQSWPSDL